MGVERQIVNRQKVVGAEVLRQIDKNVPVGSEVERFIEDRERTIGAEVERTIDSDKPIGAEVERQIVDKLLPIGMETELTIESDKPVGMEVFRETGAERSIGMEVNRQVVDTEVPIGAETLRQPGGQKPVGAEVARSILDRPRGVGSEVNRQILNQLKPVAMEIRRDKSIAHFQCSGLGYLEQPYLEGHYLSEGMCASMGWEVNRVLIKPKEVASEVERQIVDKLNPIGAEVLRQIQDRERAIGMEVERVLFKERSIGTEVQRQIVDQIKVFGAEVLLRIEKTVPVGMEVNRFRSLHMGMQTRLVLYNDKLLRILCSFPSRGTSGTNWTSTSTMAGDFSPNNLNTDIVEQVWRSASGVKAVILTCDTEIIPQGTDVDTFGILNHNLSSSATITVEGSDSPTFSPVEQSFSITPSPRNAFYVAPTAPTQQSRYWRMLINDSTNPNDYLEIGTVVFGTSVIFQGECFVDTIPRKWDHFADKVPTEGFTNVANDRSIKRKVSLEFRNLEYTGGNFEALLDLFEEKRTTLKCLWIPDPQDPTRFAVFAKLVDIPQETHRNLGADAANTVDLTVDLDESL
jgi:hypothetical protein